MNSSTVLVLEINGTVATILLPDESQEQWSTAALPSGAREGDRVQLTVTDGDLEAVILPRRVPES